MIKGFVSGEALALLFIFVGLAIAVTIKQLRKKYARIPYAPTLFLISMGLGYFSPYIGIIGDSIQEIASIDPRGILLIFLPPLIFQSSFNSDWYIFRKQSVQIFILAFPAVLVSALFIMVSIKMLIFSSSYYYSWAEAFMFGSVLSCTDTVAVLALLKEAGAPRKFRSLIEGQSLFNDGTCMVLFTISLELAKGQAPPILSIGQLFLQLTIGALALGTIFGFFATLLIRFVKNDAILVLNITVVSCYILYFTAEYVDLGIRISGIMSLVVMGLYMAAFSKTHITPEAKPMVDHIWKIYTFAAETIIFILGGVLVGTQALREEFLNMMNWMNFFALFQLYLYMILARFFSIGVFMWKLKGEGYGLRWKEVVALTHGGLRGAVGIAFTLILASNNALSLDFRVASLFNTSGCAFLTLMINAPTAKFVIYKLGLSIKSDTKVRLFKQFLKQCEVDLNQKLQDIKRNQYLQNSLWEKVQEQSGLNELRHHIKEVTLKTSQSLSNFKEKQMDHIRSNLLSDHGEDVDKALLEEIRNRFCVALKGILWEMFEKNQCSRESILALIQCVNLDLDSINQPLNSWDYLVSHIHNPYFFPFFFWLKGVPILGWYGSSQIYNRVSILYDVVSTYIQSLELCENACRSMPFEENVIYKIIQESTQNRKLAHSFLDNEIKISYDEIMKKIQTTKASQSLLTFQKSLVQTAESMKEIDPFFSRKIRNMIEECGNRLQGESGGRKNMTDIEIIKSNWIFKNLGNAEITTLLTQKVDLTFQKDESLIKPYEKQKYIYLITSGIIDYQYKFDSHPLTHIHAAPYEIIGLGTLLLPQKKQLELSAVAKSVVSVFCFNMGTMRELMSQKSNKLEEMFFMDIFLLQVRLNNELNEKIRMNEEVWRMKKHVVWFRRLGKKSSEILKNCYIVLIQGKIEIGNAQYGQGYFHIVSETKLIGPAQYYASNEQITEEKASSIARSSTAKRLSVGMCNQPSIIRRTLYTRD